jgi:hypothetical protein
MQMLKKLDVSKATLANIFLETRALREFSAEVAGGSCWPENGLTSLTGQTPPMRTNSVGCVSSYELSRWIWSQLGLDERPLLAQSGRRRPIARLTQRSYFPIESERRGDRRYLDWVRHAT